MKLKGSKRRLLEGAALVSLCVSVAGVTEDQDGNFLRRNRLKRPTEAIGGSSSTDEVPAPKAELTKMEDLWSQAASVVQHELEAERILQWRSSDDSMFSMPTRPPSGPTSPTGTPTRRPTPQPSGPPVDCLQGRTREEYIFDLLVAVTPEELLNDETTPQGKAFRYLASEDPHLTDPCISETIEQRFGLTTFYYSTLGDSWISQSGWLGEDQECLWFGVDCLGGNPNVVTRVKLCKFSLKNDFDKFFRLLTNLIILCASTYSEQ